jgi:polyphosphate kinase
MFPVEATDLKQRLVRLLRLYFADNVKARRLRPDGRYERVREGSERISVQEKLMEEAVERTERASNIERMEIRPRKPLRE